jgi:hypothetical protein
MYEIISSSFFNQFNLLPSFLCLRSLLTWFENRFINDSEINGPSSTLSNKEKDFDAQTCREFFIASFIH